MLKKIIKMLLNRRKHYRSYSSSDKRHRYRGYNRKGHSHYGHSHYKRKHKSGSFFSSFFSS
ncbi:hypothetical protein [Bacillus taeanensis]|uniref:Uncharacterized protein n=1 Tax=Bacillus taeanensis TaxID=273032 RepID=A0A366XZ43_9BACI|nr:hypothetical protein [Bacillus taeanensis]RBW69201.1 hypothetical protein DS031_12520 [Bacillus taeanensis]